MCSKSTAIIKELVSIIVPVYNVEQYLTICLDSLINQTYSNLEIMLVNDGSCDKSGTICEQYALADNRIKVIKQENLGPSVARNKALDECHGSWVVFCDSDDYLDRHTIETSLQYALKYEAEIVRYGYVKHYSNGKSDVISIDSPVVLSNMSDIILTMERTQYFSFACMSIMRRSVIADERFDVDLRYCEDHLFTLSCYKNTKRIAFVPECFYHYNIHDSGSLSTPKDYLGIIKQANRELEIKQILVKPSDEAYRSIWAVYCGKINFAVSVFFIVDGTYRGANTFFKDSISSIKRDSICSHSKRSKMFFFSKFPFPFRYLLLRYILRKDRIVVRL